MVSWDWFRVIEVMQCCCEAVEVVNPLVEATKARDFRSKISVVRAIVVTESCSGGVALKMDELSSFVHYWFRAERCGNFDGWSLA